MKTSLKLLAALAFALASLTSARAADIDGKWRAEFESQIGKQTYVFDLKAGADGKLTGKAAFERMEQKGEAELKEGKITKDEVSFVEPLKFQDQELRKRASQVIPGGMWGHMNVARIPVDYPQYFANQFGV